MNRYKPSLSRNDIESQIHRMVAFIDHEARERAEEIDSKTEGEFCYEKGRLLHKARQDMQRIYEKKGNNRLQTRPDDGSDSPEPGEAARAGLQRGAYLADRGRGPGPTAEEE
ncbi:hypothetical protein J6590_030569 [Homalodisca vitripennis]|nr:hypothetical protein J6590_030569 [Homalodisca vitripennis]